MKNALVLLLLASVLASLAYLAIRVPGDEVGAAEVRGTVVEDPIVTPALLAEAPDETQERVAESAPIKTLEPSESVIGEPRGSNRNVSYTIRGRVLDVRGNPVLGVNVTRDDDEEVLAITAGDGSFEFETTKRWFTIRPRSEEWVGVRHARIDVQESPPPGGEPEEALIVVAQEIAVSGFVYDTSGSAIPESRVNITLAMGALIEFPFPLDSSITHGGWSADVSETGAFAFVSAPGHMKGARIEANAAGFVTLTQPAPQVPTQGLILTLQPEEPEETAEEPESVVRGTVVGPDGGGVPDALVVLRSASVRTKTDGSFELVPEDYVPMSEALIAAKVGHRAAIRADFGAEVNANPNPPAVVLQLGVEPLSIEGVVVDASGDALDGWKLRLLDPTYMEKSNTAESAEAFAAGDPGEIVTDKEGRFRIGGLSDRNYELRAWDEVHYMSVDSGPVPAGTKNLELRVPADALHESVTGRVVSLAGLPVPSAKVGVSFTYESSPSGTSSIQTAHAITDSDGRFALKDVPARHVRVDVAGDDIIGLQEPWEGDLPESGLVLVVERRCHFRVEWVGAGDPPTAITAFDADGEYTYISTRTAHSVRSSTRHELEDGLSSVVSTTERSTALSYQRDGKELGRVDVTFVPGEVTAVQLGGN